MADTTVSSELIEFRLPSLGSDMDSGTVVRWRVGPGDAVRKGDVLVDVDTDKAEIEVEVWHDGSLAEILVEPGTEVPVGTPLAMLRPAGPDARPAASAAASVSGDAPEPTPAPEARQPPQRPPHPAPPTPVARPGVAEPMVTPRTVFWPAAGQPPPPPPDAGPKPSPAGEAASGRADRMRRVIAGVMSRANAEIPHYHLMADVDLEATVQWLSAQNEQRPVTSRILPAAVMVKAVALATAAHPQLNGFWLDDEFRPADGVHIGVAVHIRGGGLVAPAITDADTKPLDTVMAELRDLVGRARTGRLRRGEMTAASVTVTNLGDLGADAVLGVIHPPQVALIGFGRVTERPTVRDGSVEVGSVATITLSADHRATDGHVGARFLATVDHHLQHPEEL